jgi:hypothetical protein
MIMLVNECQGASTRLVLGSRRKRFESHRAADQSSQLKPVTIEVAHFDVV